MRALHRTLWFLVSGLWLLPHGCGYTTRPGLPTYLKTVYVKPFVNRIDLTQIASNEQRFPLYRAAMERDITKEVINRFQFTGLLRPAASDKADSRLEGELVEFRRDALRYDSAQHVEEWRLSVVANVTFYDVRANEVMWQVERLTGDTTYFERGAKAEAESVALERAIKDLAKRVVEQTVENW